MIFGIVCSIALTGCGTARVILVPDGQPVMLAEPVRTRVYVFDSNGRLTPSSNKVVLPAGWYALPDRARK